MTNDHSGHQRRGTEAERREAMRKAQLREMSQAADLDEALEGSFPASDPPSMTQPRTHLGAPKRDNPAAPAPQRQRK